MALLMVPTRVPLHSMVGARAAAFSSHSAFGCSATILKRRPGGMVPPSKIGSYPLRVQSIASPAREYVTEQSFTIDEFPSLPGSLAIPGLPPCQDSMFGDEVEARMLKMKSYQQDWMKPYIDIGVSSASFMHNGASTCSRLKTIGVFYGLITMFDDTLFDIQSDSLRQHNGIMDRDSLKSPHELLEYLNTVDVLFRQEDRPHNPTLIQYLMWEVGCEFRSLSTADWFTTFADTMYDYYGVCLDSITADVEGKGTYIEDLESYRNMRVRNSGGYWAVLLVEYTNGLFLPSEIRMHPIILQMRMAFCIHFSFVNDIISFSKEQNEPHSRNLIKVLMTAENLTLPQAAWRAVDIINSACEEYFQLKTQFPTSWRDEPWYPAVDRYYEGLKEFMSGNLHWHAMNKRYRVHDAAFPDLRDLDVSFFTKAEQFNPLTQQLRTR